MIKLLRSWCRWGIFKNGGTSGCIIRGRKGFSTINFGITGARTFRCQSWRINQRKTGSSCGRALNRSWIRDCATGSILMTGWRPTAGWSRLLRIRPYRGWWEWISFRIESLDLNTIQHYILIDRIYSFLVSFHHELIITLPVSQSHPIRGRLVLRIHCSLLQWMSTTGLIRNLSKTDVLCPPHDSKISQPLMMQLIPESPDHGRLSFAVVQYLTEEWYNSKKIATPGGLFWRILVHPQPVVRLKWLNGDHQSLLPRPSSTPFEAVQTAVFPPSGPIRRLNSL